jgi:fibronectin-binding autotransporter adhesin
VARNKAFVLQAIVLAFLISSNVAHGQVDPFAPFSAYQWSAGAGTFNWQVAGNWAISHYPDDIDPLTLPEFPNDTDPLDDIFPTANISGAYGANLNVNIGNTPVIIAGLDMGGTSSPITSEISSTDPAGKLTFRNDYVADFSNVRDADFDQDGRVTGRDFLIWQRGFGAVGDNINDQGDADYNDVVEAADLPIWQDQYGYGTGLFSEGNAYLFSGGVAGSVNRIMAPIHIDNDAVQIAANIPLVIDTGADITTSTLTSGASMSVINGTVTINSNILLVDSDADPLTSAQELALNSSGRTTGTMIVNGDIKVVDPAVRSGIRLGGGSGWVELYGDNEVTGGVVTGGNVLLGNDRALGVSPTDPNVVARVRPGGTHYSNDDSRTIPNNFLLSGDFRTAGDHSLTLTGLITQTNNDGIVNNIGNGKTLNIDGTVAIWGDEDTTPEREFDFEGSGKTVITGKIIPLDPQVLVDFPTTVLNHAALTKAGNGVLVIDVAPGDNNHNGPEIVKAGNWHFASNDSLNASTAANAVIRSIAGAVGVDVHPAGLTLATNTTFIGKIEANSQGGLMLAISDAAVDINFTAASPWPRARNMSLAAPETGLSYTGTITPFNSQYRLGGGSGTLTLPNDNQLTNAARSLTIRNGGTVSLQGRNNYGGATVVEGKYTDNGGFISTTLEVTELANGGVSDAANPSSIGNSSSDASNLVIQGGTLRYIGSGDSTDRLFSIGTHGATLDSSGIGAVAFTNTGATAIPDAADIYGDLDENSGNPNVIYNITNAPYPTLPVLGATFRSRDVVIGMTVSDPDPRNLDTDLVGTLCGPDGVNCIPAVDGDGDPVVITGVSADSQQLGFSASIPFIQKLQTRLVFGAVARTLTLTGDNSQANILSPVLSNSVKGSQLGITKTGTGAWYLEGANTNTGPTLVEAGTLGGNGGVGGALTLSSGATFAPGTPGVSNGIGDFSVAGSFTLNSGGILGIQLGGTGAGQYDVLNVTGAAALAGIINLSAVSFSASISDSFTVLTAAGGITDNGLVITGLSGFTKSIVGNSLVLTKTAALSALASVPEPTSMAMIGMALAFLSFRRK